MCGGPAWKREIVPDHKVGGSYLKVAFISDVAQRVDSLTLSIHESSPTMGSLCE